jgi:hypothetical protein
MRFSNSTYSKYSTHPNNGSILSGRFDGGNGTDGNAVITAQNKREVVALTFRQHMVLDEFRYFAYLQAILAVNVFEGTLGIDSKLWIGEERRQLLPTPTHFSQHTSEAVINQSTTFHTHKLINAINLCQHCTEILPWSFVEA